MGEVIRALNRHGNYVTVYRPAPGEPLPAWPSAVWPGCPICAEEYRDGPREVESYNPHRAHDAPLTLVTVSRPRINHDPVLHNPAYDPETRKRRGSVGNVRPPQEAGDDY